MKRYTAGFLFNEPEDRVLLVQKQRPEWQRGRWNGIGGGIEEGETPAECQRREFREETGLDIPDWTHFATLHDADNDKFSVAFFYAHHYDLAGAATVTDEVVCEFHVNGLPNVIPNLRWLIPMALSMKLDSATTFDVAEQYHSATVEQEIRARAKGHLAEPQEAQDVNT